MAYRAISGNLQPDHATIARFRVKIDDVLEDLFVEVLTVLADAGMIDTSVVALDGTRMAGVASIEANRSGDKLAKMHAEARRILDEAAQADTAADTSNGAATESTDADAGGGGVRRSSVSRKATDRVRRVGRIGAAVEVVAHAEKRRDVVEAKRQKPFNPVGNVTDPESRMQKTRGGFIQGYNAQSVVSSDQVVIACDVTLDSTDSAQFVPMLEQSRDNIAAAGVSDPISVVLADAGYGSATNFNAENELGMCLLVSTSKRRTVKEHADKAAEMAERDRARIKVLAQIKTGDCTHSQAAEILGVSLTWTGTLYRRWCESGTLQSPEALAWQAMTDRLAVPANKALYKQRSPKIEGSFAHIKTHRRTDSFIRHGLKACQAEWYLINLVGNIMKLHKKLAGAPSGPPTGGSRHGFRPIFDTQSVSHPFSLRNRRFGTRIRHHQPCRRVTT